MLAVVAMLTGVAAALYLVDQSRLTRKLETGRMEPLIQ
jgi:hypothetical protein